MAARINTWAAAKGPRRFGMVGESENHVAKWQRMAVLRLFENVDGRGTFDWWHYCKPD